MVLSHGEADGRLSGSELAKHRSLNKSKVNEADQHRFLRDFELPGKDADGVFSVAPQSLHVTLRHEQAGGEVVGKLLSPLR